jgi:co-chaperonin GroES (HSP10)
MKVTGRIKPLHDKVFVSDMEFGAQQTSSGIYIPSLNGKADGIVPRWGKVWAIGDEQRDVQVGDWIMVEHGRWTRTIEYENEDGSVVEVRMVDSDAIMMISDEPPADAIYIRPD